MSIQAMAWVLEQSESQGNDRLVLLAIANHCDAQFWNAWPSIDQIAREAGVHRATVFRCLKTLVDLGELRITHSGGGRALSNHYHLPGIPSQVATVSARKPSQSSRETVANQPINSRTAATRTVSNRQEPTRVRAREAADFDRSQHRELDPLDNADRERGKSMASALRSRLAPTDEEES